MPSWAAEEGLDPAREAPALGATGGCTQLRFPRREGIRIDVVLGSSAFDERLPVVVGLR